MGFKDIVKSDVKKVFLNLEEFGEMHRIDDRDLLIIMDNNEMQERDKVTTIHDDGLYIKRVLFYVDSVDFGSLPAVGKLIKVDGKRYRVTDAIDEGGIFSICLEVNIA